jgi:pimeloyl-ACP methyl ester carboxylesterase
LSQRAASANASATGPPAGFSTASSALISVIGAFDCLQKVKEETVREIINAIAIAITLGLSGVAVADAAENPKPAPKPAHTVARNVVLVHGAWADGSSWAEVIPLLQAAGLSVTAVQNPLTSLADSVAETRRALALQDGPTVLVAHSWGGTVISEAGADPKVTSLVYVAARAPDAGEDFVALSAEFPAGPVRAGIQVNDGFSRLSEDSFLKYFANGVAPRQAKILYAVQEPTAATIFGGRTSEAAWHSKPSFYAVSKQDKTINPDLERFLAKRMHATTVEIDAGHLSLVSHPKEVADLILAAAGR